MSAENMRAVAIGVGAALSVYLLNVLPGVLAFGLGLVVAASAHLTQFDAFRAFTASHLMSVLTNPSGAGGGTGGGSGAFSSILPSRRPKTVRDVQQHLRAAGLENCSLVVGIDFTKSNLEQGYVTFHGQSLHALDAGRPNPYQSVISIVGDTLAAFDDDGDIPAFYFGDKTTRDHSVKPLGAEGKVAHGFQELLEQYGAVVPTVKMDGPTSFAPLIQQTCALIDQAAREKGTYEFHVLVIITDGAVNDNGETAKAIVAASKNYPLAIVAVGVGDGPWDRMEEFDNDLPERGFDNFTFVNYEAIKKKYDGSELVFAEEALREAPAQFQFAHANGYLCKYGPARASNRRVLT